MLSAKLQCCEDGKGNTYFLVQTFMVRMKAFGGTLFFLLHKRSASPLSITAVLLDLYMGCSFNLHLLFSLANDHYSDPLALVRGIDANDGECYSFIALSTSKIGKKITLNKSKVTAQPSKFSNFPQRILQRQPLFGKSSEF